MLQPQEKRKHLQNLRETKKMKQKRKKFQVTKIIFHFQGKSTRGIREQHHIEESDKKLDTLTLEVQSLAQTTKKQDSLIKKLKEVLKEKELEIQNMKSEQTKAKNLHDLSKLKKTNNGSDSDSLEKYVEEMEKIKKENLELNLKVKELNIKLVDQKEENIMIKTQMTRIIDEQSVVYDTHINEFINQIYEV
jgi:hypothetical protein